MTITGRLVTLIPGRTAEQTTSDTADENATDASDSSDPTADPDADGSPGDTVCDTGRATRHATRVAPSGVRLDSAAARAGDHWVKTLFVTGFPQEATPGLLDRVCTHPSADVDVTIYAEPEDQRTSILAFEHAIKSLKVDLIEARKQGSAKDSVIERRIREHEMVYQQLQADAQQVFDVGVYLTIRGDSKEQVETVATNIRGALQRQRLTTKTAAYRQGDALGDPPVQAEPKPYDLCIGERPTPKYARRSGIRCTARLLMRWRTDTNSSPKNRARRAPPS